jgi:hypothetical protein
MVNFGLSLIYIGFAVFGITLIYHLVFISKNTGGLSNVLTDYDSEKIRPDKRFWSRIKKIYQYSLLTTIIGAIAFFLGVLFH